MKYNRLMRCFGLTSESFRYSLCRVAPLVAVALCVAIAPGRTHADTLSVQIADGNDDSEENPGGAIDLGSSDLEIGAQGGAADAQWIGMRFLDIDIPRGATINSANIQFTVDEVDDEVQADPIQIFGEVGDASAFTTSPRDITNRDRTGAFVEWSDIPAWSTEGDAGPDQQTPDIARVIQSIVNQESWSPNNAMVILMSPLANFERTAESFSGSADDAALLTIDFDPSKLILFGDFNSDGAIDLADFQVLSDNFHIGTTFAEGDFTFDGTVDLHDFAGFRKAFEGAPVAAAASVPEPGAMPLALMTLAGLNILRRRR